MAPLLLELWSTGDRLYTRYSVRRLALIQPGEVLLLACLFAALEGFRDDIVHR